MKAKTHPKYHEKAKVTCSCGNSFEVGSTKPEIQIEVCSACHPYYTGKSKLVDTAGRVDKFKERISKKSKLPIRSKRKKREKVKAAKIAKKVEK
ncbi:MAG: hypothetical protein ACD_63C00052G0002 [uncultured bacterium]|nr:MAG: hypothetical protein ACD_63C00052G0002 [uncultured bacterium]